MFLTKMRIKTKWDEIKKKIMKPEIYPEAFYAYFHKLPNNIQVEWFRDDKYIVGKIDAEGKKFVTQGIDADDFIKMVNESVSVSFDIPRDYMGLILKNKLFSPPEEERRKLNDMTVKRSVFSFVNLKTEGDLQLA